MYGEELMFGMLQIQLWIQVNLWLNLKHCQEKIIWLKDFAYEVWKLDGTECSKIADGPESTCNATMDDTAGGATPCAWTSTNICTYTAAKFYSSMNQKDKPAGCLLYPGFEPGGATGKIIFNF